MATKQMTVRELYDALAELLPEHGDLPVVSEGCDCDGDVGEAKIRLHFGKSVCYLTRFEVEYLDGPNAQNEVVVPDLGPLP